MSNMYDTPIYLIIAGIFGAVGLLVGLVFLIVPIDVQGDIDKNKELAKSWAEQRQIESAIVRCFENGYCDVAYRENGNLYLVKLACNTRSCQVAAHNQRQM